MPSDARQVSQNANGNHLLLSSVVGREIQSLMQVMKPQRSPAYDQAVWTGLSVRTGLFIRSVAMLIRLFVACLGMAISFAAIGDANILYRQTPTAKFIIDYDGNGVVDKQIPFGISTDVGLVGDLNNSGSFDLVLFRNGTWYVDTNRDGTVDQTYIWGQAGDVPILADFTRPGGGSPDGQADLVVFRSGLWYVSAGHDGLLTSTYILGAGGDKPVVGDVNGDGVLDIAVFRNGFWYVSTNKSNPGHVDIQFAFGAPGDVPVLLDWNNDGKADACLFRNGIWYINLNRGGGTPFNGTVDVQFGFGASGDIPRIGASRYFGYYTTFADTASQSAPHSNLAWWLAGFPDASYQATKTAGIYSAILDISWLVYCNSADGINCNGSAGDKWIYRGTAAATSNLRSRLDSLRSLGVLNMLVALYPMDEPDLWLYHPGDIVSANDDIRAVMSSYPELHATKLAVIYGAWADYATWHIEKYDWVGFDDYGSAQWIFTAGGEYDDFKPYVGPNQRVLLVPGGTTHPSDGIPPYNPTPSFASVFGSDLSVIGMIPYIWENIGGLGIRDYPDRKHNYCVVGAPIKGVSTSICP